MSIWTWVSRYQNVSSLYFIAPKGDGGGGDNWSYKKCKTPIKSSPPTNQCPPFYRPVTQPTVSKHWTEQTPSKLITSKAKANVRKSGDCVVTTYQQHLNERHDKKSPLLIGKTQADDLLRVVIGRNDYQPAQTLTRVLQHHHNNLLVT